MPSVRRHVWIDAPAEAVWTVLRDTPRHEYHPEITASSRSKDGTIHREEFTAPNLSKDVRGDVLTVTIHSQVIESDNELRRLRIHPFAVEGTYNLMRPWPADAVETFDVLEVDDGGCILVVATTGVPETESKGSATATR